MRDDRLLLLDILDSIAEVKTHTPTDRQAFDATPLVQSHVIQREAMYGLKPTDIDALTHLPRD